MNSILVDNKILGVSVDIGTTTVAVSLIDLKTGKVIDTKKVLNPQKSYGADVISRILHVNEHPSHILGKVIKETIEGLTVELINENMKSLNTISKMVIAGNTTMIYLLLGMDPEALAVSPFTTVDIGIVTIDAKELFKTIKAVEVTILPYISAYVGGDIVSGMFANHIIDKNENIVFIDIGTNGEIVLKTKDRIRCASTAAGPAFEGANIRCGMGSVSGAICEITEHEITEHEITTVGYNIVTLSGSKPQGICGSALIDAIALLHKQGYIKDNGYMEKPHKIIDDIFIYPEDVRQVQLAKAAIMAGVDVLLLEAGLKYEDIQTVYIAGGFGSHINIKNTAYIGMIPKEIVDKVVVVGNAALAGAVRYLLEKNGETEINKLISTCEYVELSTNMTFNEAYIMNMSFGGAL